MVFFFRTRNSKVPVLIIKKLFNKNINIVGNGFAARGNTLKLQIYTKNNIVLKTQFNVFDNNQQKIVDSVMTEWLTGQNITTCLNISNNDITNYFKLSQDKINTSILIERAVKIAITDYTSKIV